MILIHGSPGSRLGFLNAFLTNSLETGSYHVGATNNINPFFKLHTFEPQLIKNFNGPKIYISLSDKLLWLHLFLFFEKNVLLQLPEYKTFHFTHRNLFDKFFYSSKMWYEDEEATDFEFYDFVVPFENTYNLEYLTDLYIRFNGCDPSLQLMKTVASSNQANLPFVDHNHCVRVAATLFNFERQHGLLESDRLWALNDTAPFEHESGECLDPENLFSNIVSKLTLNNYR